MSDLDTFKRVVNLDNLSPEELEVFQKKLFLRKKTFDFKQLSQNNFLKFV